jgi:hypothetical protein
VSSAGLENATNDIVSLWRLQARYADIITRRAWAELREVFLPETTVQIDTVTAPQRSLVGPDALGDFVSTAIERFDHFTFVILNTVVDVESPDHARGRIFMCEIRHDTASDEWQVAHGCYQDRYQRVDDRWWFADRHYRSMARTGPDGAVFGLPAGLGPLGG